MGDNDAAGVYLMHLWESKTIKRSVHNPFTVFNYLTPGLLLHKCIYRTNLPVL